MLSVCDLWIMGKQHRLPMGTFPLPLILALSWDFRRQHVAPGRNVSNLPRSYGCHIQTKINGEMMYVALQAVVKAGRQ